MIKNLKRMALLFVAAATMLNVSCKKEEQEQKPEPETPQIMNIVGTSWKFYYEGDVQGMEIVMSDELQIQSADSLLRIVHAEMGQNIDQSATVYYTWDGSILSIPSMNLSVTYRESDDVFVRATDDPESVQVMAMLGLEEFLYHRQ